MFTDFRCKGHSCLYYCFNYSTLNNKFREKLDTYYVFMYHPDISTSVDFYMYQCKQQSFNQSWNRRITRGRRCGPNKGYFGKCLKGSWKEASEVCAELGGTLPIIRSRKELDELISLLYLPKLHPPIMTIVFIGLEEKQVGYNSAKIMNAMLLISKYTN